MTSIEFWGAVNTLFISVSVYGVFSQLSTIRKRRRERHAMGNATDVLSLNQFTVSFFAYFAFFVYGYSIQPFNHFIVWPRLTASIFVLVILYEIWRDRRSHLTKLVFGMALSALMIGFLGLLFSEQYAVQGQWVSTLLILVISVLIAQGYAHQIRLIIRQRDTGAVDIKMSQFILLMDFSTIALAIAIGLDKSWPLLVLAVTSAITKLIILYLFRWVRLNNQELISSQTP